MEYKVSVIVPIYKVEKYIYRCAYSLLEQSLQDVEIIFVDDCTPDNSINILKELISHYPEKEKAIKLLCHDENMGLPSARNTGLKHATGEFIFHCDSDDWLDTNALELLYNKCVSENADIVYADWYLAYQHNNRYMSQSSGSTDVISPGLHIIKLMLGGCLKFNVWNKLVKRNLYINNKIYFPEGYGMGEDMTMIKLFSFTDKVTYLNKAVYYYSQINMDAFTKTTSERHLEELQYNVEDISCFLYERYGNRIEKYIHFFKLNVKFPFLISSKKESYKLWRLWYKDSNVYIGKNPLSSRRSEILQVAALNKHDWFLKCYNLLVMRLLYGILYK